MKEWKNKTNEDLKQIAIDMYHKKIFTSLQLTDQQIRDSFRSITFASFPTIQYFEDNKVSLIYEYLDKADQVWNSGLPIFLSAKFANKLELDKILKYLEEYKMLVENFLRD